MRRVACLRTQRIRGRTSAWLDRSIQALIWKLRCDHFGSKAAFHSRQEAKPERLASLLLRHKIPFSQSVVLSDIASHQPLPSVHELYGVYGIKMCAKRGLISPAFHQNEFSRLWVFHRDVIGNVSFTLPRRDSKRLKLGLKPPDVFGRDG